MEGIRGIHRNVLSASRMERNRVSRIAILSFKIVCISQNFSIIKFYSVRIDTPYHLRKLLSGQNFFIAQNIGHNLYRLQMI